MKRTPLKRKTPLSNGKGFNGQRMPRIIVDEGDAIESFEPFKGEPKMLFISAPPINEESEWFKQARADSERRIKLALEVDSWGPRAFTGPVVGEVRSTRPKATGFPAAVRQTILDRDHYACARCGINIDTSSLGYSLQHRDNRGMGGSRNPATNKAGNGLVLCGSGTTGCHGWTEQHPTEAERLGYAVASWADPTTVPVLIRDRGWVLLDHDGRRTPVKAPTNNDAHTVATRKAPL